MSRFERRRFLQAASAAAALPAVAAEAQSPQAADTAADRGKLHQSAPHGMTVDRVAKCVAEAPRRTPVAADVDVLVIGGGPTGVGAALAAAREGARVLVVERHGMLGGVWTAGLLNPLFDAVGKGWVVADLIDRLQQANAWQRWKFSWVFDTEIMKRLLEAMMAEAKVDLWYYSYVVDAIVEQGQVRGAIVESKSGREAVLARVVIDCSGDGDLAARAGVPFRLGRALDGLCQPMTLMYEMEGVADYEQKDTAMLYEQMLVAIEARKLKIELPFGRVNYAPWIIHVPRPDTAAVQATHVYNVGALDTRDLTRATIEARRQAHQLTEVFQVIPGLHKAHITQTAPAIGVREARRLVGRYYLDLEDLRAGRRFDDAVTYGAFGVDIHDVKRNPTEKSAHHTPMRPYEIPYRCLLPEALDGLLFAGRCISGSHEAHASYRVTGTCMGMGQAAGLAAAMAVKENRSPAALSGTAVHQALAERKVGFLKTK